MQRHSCTLIMVILVMLADAINSVSTNQIYHYYDKLHNESFPCEDYCKVGEKHWNSEDCCASDSECTKLPQISDKCKIASTLTPDSYSRTTDDQQMLATTTTKKYVDFDSSLSSSEIGFIVAGVACVACVCLLLAGIVCWCCIRKSKEVNRQRSNRSYAMVPVTSESGNQVHRQQSDPLTEVVFLPTENNTQVHRQQSNPLTEVVSLPTENNTQTVNGLNVRNEKDEDEDKV